MLAPGLNHHSALLELRARFAFTRERLPAALHSLRARLPRAAPEATLLALRLSLQLFEDLTQLRVLLAGAGEMVELTAAHFAGRKPLSITLANRTAERNQALARRCGAKAMARVVQQRLFLHGAGRAASGR